MIVKPYNTMCESSKFPKSWTFEIKNLKHAVYAFQKYRNKIKF